jgi:lysophospholipase L1-like esterase
MQEKVMTRGHVASFLAVFLAAGRLWAADESAFVPLAFPQGDTENRTGMWLCADLGGAANILPLKTRMWATKESVTGGVALKCVFERGSRGSLNFENEVKPPGGSAGITFYAKASRDLKLNVNKATANVGADWKKIDLTWEALGTTREQRDLGWLLTISVAEPIQERTWLIIDRLGVEKPDFIKSPRIDPRSGPDETISSKDILYGAENLSKTLRRAKARQPFKIYAFGDSITLGAQMYRGTWKVRGKDGIPFLYHSHLARLWEEQFGYKGITVVHGGQAGSLKDWHLKNLGPFLKDATADDVVIIALSGGTPDAWKRNLKTLIETAKTKTDQIIVMSSTPGGSLVNQVADMTRVLQDLVREEKVAAADITRFALYRGQPYCWAGEGNEWHPTYELHITLAEMMAPLLTGEDRTWPENRAATTPR